MDELDKQILDIIQSGFPLAPHPYDIVGEQVGLSGEDVLERVNRLRKDGVIRRMGASFQSRKLGWKSTLCAAKVGEDKMDEFVAEVNKHPGVTHNYLRKHEFNIWFTMIGPNWEEIEADLGRISEKTGVRVFNLPATIMFKIKVDFDMQSGKRSDEALVPDETMQYE